VENVHYLFSDPKRVGKALKGKFVYLFLDYDGTLAPIVRVPDNAVIPNATKELLRQLSKTPDCKVAIVSGRSLKDVSRRVGLKDVVYVGNHGFQVKGPKIRFKSPLLFRYRRKLKEIKAELKKSISAIKGVLIEDKGFSLSVHYRPVDKKDIPKVETGFYGATFLYEFDNSVRINSGKMILEVLPPLNWDKGKAVQWLLSNRPFVKRNKKMKTLPIYIGDDTTDEDAFKWLKDKGLTIFVGKPKKTKARFYLKDTSEVAEFLDLVLESKRVYRPWKKKS